jgi:hypothetical protein
VPWGGIPRRSEGSIAAFLPRDAAGTIGPSPRRRPPPDQRAAALLLAADRELTPFWRGRRTAATSPSKMVLVAIFRRRDVVAEADGALGIDAIVGVAVDRHQVEGVDAPDRGPCDFYCLLCSIRRPRRCIARNERRSRGLLTTPRSRADAHLALGRRHFSRDAFRPHQQTGEHKVVDVMRPGCIVNELLARRRLLCITGSGPAMRPVFIT